MKNTTSFTANKQAVYFYDHLGYATGQVEIKMIVACHEYHVCVNYLKAKGLNIDMAQNVAGYFFFENEKERVEAFKNILKTL